MGDVFVLKTADDVDDRIHFPDVGQELVPQSLPSAGALHQARDVDKLEGGGDDPLGLKHLGQTLQPLVGNVHHPHIGIDRAEGIVGRFGSCAGDRIEQGRFADIGQTDDSGHKRHIRPLPVHEAQVCRDPHPL